jgi:hypothetical protein
MAESEATPSNSVPVDRLQCPKCGSVMWLVRIEPRPSAARSAIFQKTALRNLSKPFSAIKIICLRRTRSRMIQLLPNQRSTSE